MSLRLARFYFGAQHSGDRFSISGGVGLDRTQAKALEKRIDKRETITVIVEGELKQGRSDSQIRHLQNCQLSDVPTQPYNQVTGKRHSPKRHSEPGGYSAGGIN